MTGWRQMFFFSIFSRCARYNQLFNWYLVNHQPIIIIPNQICTSSSSWLNLSFIIFKWSAFWCDISSFLVWCQLHQSICTLIYSFSGANWDFPGFETVRVGYCARLSKYLTLTFSDQRDSDRFVEWRNGGLRNYYVA